MLVLMRGDHALVEQKLPDGTRHGRAARRPHARGDPRGARRRAGSLGAVGVTGMRIVADEALRGRRDMATGANEDGFHLRGVDVERDIEVDEWLDLREVEAGEACPMCGAPLRVDKTIEVGHIFKLGTRTARRSGVTVLDEDGDERTDRDGLVRDRGRAQHGRVVETHHDDKGSSGRSPSRLRGRDDAREGRRRGHDAAGEPLTTSSACRSRCADRRSRGTPGREVQGRRLIGIPYRVTVGPRGFADGEVELSVRSTGERSEIPSRVPPTR